jgi:hypothetical protein
MVMARPRAVTVRAYQVGFGDCFLLTFHYGKSGDRHVLIDFGSTGAPRGFGDLKKVAKDIQSECGGKLHAVVATHRHKDHINGFGTAGGNPGSIIASCRPDVVVQPWTEDPKARPDAKKPTRLSSGSKALVSALIDMHAVARAILTESSRLESVLDSVDVDEEEAVEPEPDEQTPAHRRRPLFKQLEFLGDDNLPNRSAIENLMRMGKRRGARAFYVHTGSESGFESVLPGVKVTVLGPPTLEQTATIRSERQRDEAEYWHFQARASRLAAARKGKPLFPNAPVLGVSERPKWSRWLLRRLRGIRGDQLREIVRILDKAMNNTSVILLFDTGKHKLLFPGDAQIENWQYALDQARYRKLLKDVTFYKVGHHGSLNGTPKSLWNGFKRKSHRPTAGRLMTMLSTMKGKHGDKRRSTEVPRANLVQALEDESNYSTTESIKAKDEKLFEVDELR